MSAQGESDKVTTEHAQATTGTYLRIAAILVMITLIEVGVFYVPTFQGVLVPLLLVLSAVKFTLVAMFYMHLKQDSRIFAGVFVFPLIIACIVVVALMVLMAYHFAYARSGG